MNNAPLLDAYDLRIDIGGAIAIEGATFTTSGNSVVILGDDQGILSALACTADIRCGSLRILGTDAAHGTHLASGLVGLAPLDPPLPPRFTVREYLAWGARLAGASRATAERDATAALAEFGLEPSATQRLESLSLAERRALVIAEAAIARPAVLVGVGPLAGLGGREAAYVSAAWSAATRGRKWVVSVGSLHLGGAEGWLGHTADDVLVFASGRLVRQGRLDRIANGAVGYTLTVRTRADELRRALAERGVTVTGRPPRFFIELPSGIKAQDLLNLSVDLGAPIVELVPCLSTPSA